MLVKQKTGAFALPFEQPFLAALLAGSLDSACLSVLTPCPAQETSIAKTKIRSKKIPFLSKQTFTKTKCEADSSPSFHLREIRPMNKIKAKTSSGSTGFFHFFKSVIMFPCRMLVPPPILVGLGVIDSLSILQIYEFFFICASCLSVFLRIFL